jgi:predicted phosphate transport protein (TIGR00153 family)
VLGRLRLIPRDERFVDLFTRSAENAREGARLLVALLEEGGDVERKARRLKDVEHVGDEITHEIFTALHRTFVTPFDREDIAELARALDDVLDWIEEPARRLHLYKVAEATPLAKRFGRIIVEQADQIVEAVGSLERMRDDERVLRAAREIHRLENEADDVAAEALAGLYDGVTDVPGMIRAVRWGDLYEVLEGATDKAEHVAVVLQNIAVKRHS